MADAHANFAYSTVATAPSPATSGTSLVVQAGNGALFPTAPFQAVLWPAGANPTSTNSEIVRVTAVATDTFTITRAQESTTAQTVVVGFQIAANITKKWFTDIETSIISRSINVISTSQTLGSAASTDYLYKMSGSTANTTLTMPTAAGNTNLYTIYNADFYSITINTTASQTIDKQSSFTMTNNNTSINLISDGSNWLVI